MEQEMTIQAKAKRFKRLENVFRVSEIGVVPVPFLIMMIVNHNEWFPDVATGTKVGIGGGLAMAVMMFAVFLITLNKKQESEHKVEIGYILLMLAWVMMATIFTLMKQILEELATIMWFGTIGIAAGFGFDISRRVMHKKYIKQKDILDTAEKEQAVEQAKEERKLIKVKVKK